MGGHGWHEESTHANWLVGPDGDGSHKVDDLDLDRLGAEQHPRLGLEEVLRELPGARAIAVGLATVAGQFKGDALAGRYRYTRIWVHGNQGWRIVAGSVVAVPE